MRIAINGFGRIGRAVFKIAEDQGLDIAAINHSHGAEDAVYLLKHDTIYGRYHKDVKVHGSDFIINNKIVKILNNRDPAKLPWREMGVDLIIESTGAFTRVKDASKHIKAGAKKVIISAPCKGPGKTIVLGVNDSILKKIDKVLCIASCTTNCLAPIMKVLDQNFKIKHAFMTTDHAYTSKQSLIDGSNRDRRRGRSAALNIIPTTTGANKALVQVLPKLRGKLKGIAIRVPVANGSIIDLVAEVAKPVSILKVNQALKHAANNEMKNILEYSTEELVSSDVIGNPHSGVIDSLSTDVNGKLIKILAWYDNEFGASSRIVDLIKKIENL